MKKINRLLGIVLCLIMLLSVAACDTLEGAEPKVDAQVFSAPLSMNIRQDEDYPVKGEAAFNIELAKNEYEGAQIIFRSPKDTTFNAVIENDLVGAKGARIFKSSVEVFAQHYIFVSEHASATSPDGNYPDALIPMESYLANRDNKVEANANQAIVIVVKSSANTPAGEYTGVLKLVVGSKTQMIPINVTVWDFAVPVANNYKTAFNIWVDPFPNDMLLAGELDSTEEMYKKYYEFFLDYRVSTSYLPTYSYANNASYVEVIKEYAVREEIACYNLYTVAQLYQGTDHDGWGISEKGLEDTLKTILQACTADADLLKKAYIYVASIDEPRSTVDFNRVMWVDDIISRVKQKLVMEFDANGFFDDKPLVRESLLNIQHVSTQPWQTAYDGEVDTFCPTFDVYNDPKYMYDVTKGEGSEAGRWWYGCISPSVPYPTYHTDGDVIAARILPWMQMAYGIEGNLYWAVNLFKKWNGVYMVRDVWEDSCTWINPGGQVVSGDGQLVYPGLKYGIDGPIPTLRLLNIRDGNEDYEYLYILQDLMEQANDEHDLDYKLEDAVGELYTQLFSGVIPNIEPEYLSSARREVAQMIIALKSDAKAAFKVSNGRANTESKTLEISAKTGAAIKIDGTAVEGEDAGNGYSVFSKEIKSSGSVAVEISINGQTYTVNKAVGRTIKAVNSFEAELTSGIDYLASKNGSADDTLLEINSQSHYVTNGENSAKITLKAVPNISYQRFIAFKVPDLYKNFGSVYNLKFDVIGNGTGMYAYISLVDGSGSKHEFNSIYIPAQGVNSINVKIPKYNLVNIEDITHVAISFDSYTSGGDISFYIDNIYVE